MLLAFTASLILIAVFTGDALLHFGVELAVGVAISAVVVPMLSERIEGRTMRAIYILYVMIGFYLLYPIAMGLARSLHAHDADQALIAIDRAMFSGVDPSFWMSAHMHPLPWIIEVLQICYSTHYLLPLILTAELALRGRMSQLEEYRLIMVIGTIVMFVGNILVPTVGPRITQYEFANLQWELPGLWLTNSLRSIINSGEGLRASMTSAEALKSVYRDAFPSGHTMFTIMTILAAFQFHARVRWVFVFVGSGLIAATLLLRYHYVVDVLMGGACALVVVLLAPIVARSIGSLRISQTRPAARL